MREIIIGDIHGEYLKLDRLLKKINLNVYKDKIVFVGDYTDRGKNSYEVVQYIMQLKKLMRNRCVLVLGNHEQMMIDFYYGKNDLWKINGYEPTLESFKKNRFNPREWCTFVKNHCILMHKEENYNVAHASADGSSEDILWDRTQFLHNSYSGKITFVGHTPLKSPSNSNGMIYRYNKKYDLPTNGLINIDTGGTFDNILTACVIQNGSMEFKGVW